MIVDIENKGTYLNVSHFSDEGDLVFLHIPVPEEERFVWSKCYPNDRKKDPEWKDWTGAPVKKAPSERYDKYRIRRTRRIGFYQSVLQRTNASLLF